MLRTKAKGKPLLFGLQTLLSFLILLTASSSAFSEEFTRKHLVICSEDAGWPPFSYHPDENYVDFWGYNADLFKRIFDVNDIEYDVVIRPRKRCLRDGQKGKVDIVLDAASNEQRRKDYLLTEPVYQLTPAFFFNKNNAHLYAEPTPANALQDLFSCGQKGYIYGNFGFSDDKVALISKDLQRVLELTEKGRCDIGLARKEIFELEMKSFPGAANIAVQTLKDKPPELFYWLLNRSRPQVEALKKLIDENIAQLRASGELEKLLKQYL